MTENIKFGVAAVVVLGLIVVLLIAAVNGAQRFRDACESVGGVVVSETEWVWQPRYDVFTEQVKMEYVPLTKSWCQR